MDSPASVQLSTRAIVDLAQSGLSVDTFASEVIGVLETCLGFDTGVGIREDGSHWFVWNGDAAVEETTERGIRFARSRYAKDLAPFLEETRRTGLFLDTSLRPPARRDPKTRYYQEVLEPSGVRSMLQICARWRGRPLLRIFMHRHGRERFDEEDLERARHLVPVLEASLIACEFEGRRRSAEAQLTPRELEVARCVSRGLTNSQVATVLGTSHHTVRNQLARIYEKLELESRVELAAWVAKVPE